MKITSIERFILETIETRKMTFEEIKNESGLKENVCFNTLQALVIKNIIITNGFQYLINKNLSKEIIERINHPLHKNEESGELIESFLKGSKEVFHISKVALDEKEHKLFKAMLSNLESFVNDCHQKNKKDLHYKERTFVFWGMGHNETLINEVAG